MMFSISQRVQTYFSNFSSAALILMLAISLTSTIQIYLSGAWSDLPAHVRNISPRVFMRQYRIYRGSPREHLAVKFDLDADLRPLFNWNTKQVFIYLKAEYQTLSKPKKTTTTTTHQSRRILQNQVVFWDKIITSSEDAQLHLVDQLAKYKFYDYLESFDEANATITLDWNIQPRVGFLLYGAATEGSHVFTIPKPQVKSS